MIQTPGDWHLTTHVATRVLMSLTKSDPSVDGVRELPSSCKFSDEKL